MVHFTILACAMLTLLSSVTSSPITLTVSNITSCPKLTPRTTTPTNVRDLRPDDIKVVMAIGDSITAAFAAKGLAAGTILNINNLNENRGVSYAAGGLKLTISPNLHFWIRTWPLQDSGATTLPNFFGHYTSNLGASVGDHLVEVCFGILCPPYQYHPSRDRLNAAQSGALAHEVEYLIPQIKATSGIDMKNDWKFLNLQIGSNDLYLSCTDPFGLLPADALKIIDALETIRKNVPRVVVNLGKPNGRRNEVLPFTAYNLFTLPLHYDSEHLQRHSGVHRHFEPGLLVRTKAISCFRLQFHRLVPSLPHRNIECGCALLSGEVGELTRAAMDKHTANYNTRLLKIRNDYSSKNYTDFG
ncbi:LOW QUALITY PROTEIN: hypothetical protein BC938DRAFT_477243, partial [Jimgerdemannia flammicorona]